MNHGGATVGLGRPQAQGGRGDSAGGEDAGQTQASLRDGRRLGAGDFLPRCPQRWRGGAPISGTTAGMSLRTRPLPLGGEAGAGAVSANKAKGRPRRILPLWTYPHGLPRGMLSRTRPQGEAGARSAAYGRAHATAAAVIPPVDVAAQSALGAALMAAGDVVAHEAVVAGAAAVDDPTGWPGRSSPPRMWPRGTAAGRRCCGRGHGGCGSRGCRR